MYKSKILQSQLRVEEGKLHQLGTDIAVFLSSPTSIPQHTNFSEELSDLLGKVGKQKEKIQVINELLKGEY